MTPSSPSSVFAAIARERHDADVQLRPIIHIRITKDAIPGTPAAVPVTPERARTLGRLWALPDGSVDAAYDGRALEVVIHPEDWSRLLTEKDAMVGYAVQVGDPDRVLGIPVSHV